MLFASFILILLFTAIAQGKDKDAIVRKATEKNFKRSLDEMNSADRAKVGLSIAVIVVCAGCLAVGFATYWSPSIFWQGPYCCWAISVVCIPIALFVLLRHVGMSSVNEAKLNERMAYLKRLKDRLDAELSELEATYGPAQRVFEIGSSPKRHFIVFPETKTLWCQGTPLPYASLKAYSLLDDGRLETQSRTETLTTPRAGEVVGGALLGQAIAGETGALVGAMSAGSNSLSIGNHTTRKVHHWTVALKTDNIDAPVIYLDCGYNKSRIATEISAVLDIILGNQAKVVYTR